MKSTMTVEIRRHTPGGDTADFVRAGHEVFRDDPAWIAPLQMMIGDRLDPKKDPFHRHAEVILLTAWKEGRLVGRTSATVDRAWLDTWKDDTGHFGYFDTIDHGWLKKFIAHRIADRRLLRLIEKWLAAGVMEDGKWAASGEAGAPKCRKVDGTGSVEATREACLAALKS